jgi:glycosyltransferase involved in cell wall biosynthesis
MQGADGKRRKLRVVTLVDGIGLAGGAERLAREVVVRLDPERFERTLCVSRWSDQRESDAVAAGALAELDDAGVRFFGLGRRGAWDVPAWRPLYSLLRGGGIDVLHAHKFGSNVWAAVLGTLARTPAIVAHEHTWSFQGQPVRKLLDRRLIAARADAFLAVSEQDRRRMIEIEGIDPGKVIFVPNGIPAPPAPSGADIRGELGIGADVPVVGTVCALRPQKALDVLLEAAAKLSGDLAALRVLIVGEGPERARLEQRIAELDLGGTVMLLGQRNDVPDLLGAIDVAVCCSDFEGTPLSILEYMEASLPIVATRVGGIPDLIEPEVEGLLVEPRDPDGLAAAIARLLTDRELGAALGAGGRRRQHAEFDIGVTVRAIERIYEGLASGRTAAELGAGA